RYRTLPPAKKAPRLATTSTRSGLPPPAGAVRRVDRTDRGGPASPEGHADLFDAGTAARPSRRGRLLRLATGGGRLAAFGLYSGCMAGRKPHESPPQPS